MASAKTASAAHRAGPRRAMRGLTARISWVLNVRPENLVVTTVIADMSPFPELPRTPYQHGAGMSRGGGSAETEASAGNRDPVALAAQKEARGGLYPLNAH